MWGQLHMNFQHKNYHYPSHKIVVKMGYSSDQDNDISSNFQNEQGIKSFITQDKKHKCTHCPAVFAKRSKLQRHMRQHTGERPYTCNHSGCTKSYFSSCHLKRHLKVHESTKTVYQCTQCEKSFTFCHNLKRHFKRDHSTDNKDKISCGECGRTFNKRFQLLNHQTIHFGPAVYKCEKCGKSFQNFQRLSHHEKRGHQEKSYPCPVSGCLEIFNKWTLLRKHRKIHVTEYKCNICDKLFHLKSRLKSHFVVHSEERTVTICPYDKCHKEYFYKKNLEYHIRICHLGEKVYCDICSEGFKNKKNLISHIEEVHNEKKRKSTNKIQRKKRKDTGMPKRSVISRLIECKFPHSLEKQLIERETTIKISESPNKSSNDAQVEQVVPYERM